MRTGAKFIDDVVFVVSYCWLLRLSFGKKVEGRDGDGDKVAPGM